MGCLAIATWAALILGAPQESGLERTYRATGAVQEEWQIDESGKRSGSYKSWHSNGEVAAQGRYREGLKTGRWRTWYDTGKRESSGKYDAGFRVGPWSVWFSDGSTDELESGDYSSARQEYTDGGLRSEGELKDGLRHGRWTSMWEHGGVKAQGEYRLGRWHGPWRFFLLDGSLDRHWIGGVYDEGRRTADLADPSANGERVSIPAPGRPRWMSVSAELALRRVFGEYLEASGPERERALEVLRRAGRPLLSIVVRELLQLDFANEADSRRARTWEAELLAPACAGLAIGFEAKATPEAVAANERARLYWATLARLLEESPAYFEIRLRGLARAKPSALLSLADVVPPVTDGSDWPADARRVFEFPYALRWEGSTHSEPPARTRGDENERLPEADARAIERGLEWLALHQSFDGAWRGTDFLANCDPASGMACTGAAEENLAEGLTGLALLAFLANGDTPDFGPFRDTVARAVGWLAAQQDERGFMGPTQHLHWIYRQAIATLALCEALRFHEDDYLRLACERAVAILHEARNPYGAWRYDFPPQGEQDTSITAWVVQALRAADVAGIAVDPATYQGALAWIDEVTDPATYRTGYDVVGSATARTEKNVHYKHDGEAMTSAALLVKFLAGVFPGESASMERQVELVLRRLPEWDPDGLGNDMYAWYYGSHAMSQVGGSAWRQWSTAMRHTALDSQRTDSGFAGSWDVDAAWGYMGGRVYTTAMMLLCLEAGHRLQRFEESGD